MGNLDRFDGAADGLKVRKACFEGFAAAQRFIVGHVERGVDEPGQTVFARMPCAPKSRAIALVKVRTAPLLAV